MRADNYIIDTSALLTLFEDEIGADHVEQVLKTEKASLPWIVLLEMYYITNRERNQSEADYRYALVKHLPVKIHWEMNEQILLTAARIKATHRLSLADAMVAAYAIQQGAVLVHKDPEFENLSDDLILEPLPFKVK